MGFWKNLFGKKVSESPATDIRFISENASRLIADSLNIIAEMVDIKPGMVQVSDTGSEGKVMEAAKKLCEAHLLHPTNPSLHYAYASCLHLAMQFQTAEEEMRKCAEAHPDFLLAKLALGGWGKWQSMFTLPPWGPNMTSIHPCLAEAIKTFIILPVRDQLIPRAALFYRDVGGDFKNLSALRSAHIALASVISPVRNPQVIGIYARIYDDPKNPLDAEIVDTPFRQRGEQQRSTYEYLCLQEDIDFVVLDRHNNILINKRLPIPENMQKINKKIFAMLQNSEGQEISTTEFINAIRRHQEIFSPKDVRY